MINSHFKFRIVTIIGIFLFIVTVILLSYLDQCRKSIDSLYLKQTTVNVDCEDHCSKKTNTLSKSGVIQIVHQSWKTRDLPNRFRKWAHSWPICYPNWTHKFWTDAKNRRLIERDYPWFLQTYDSLPHDINRADAARYFYMHRYGGVYADLDAECLQPFSQLLVGHQLVFGAMEGQYKSFLVEGYTQNSFMYSTANHPFWLEMIYGIMNYKGSIDTLEAHTGPILLINTINDYRKRYPNGVKVYPPKYFNPFSWIATFSKSPKDGSFKALSKECQVNNNMSDREIAICRASFNESYIIQYHSHSWGKGVVVS